MSKQTIISSMQPDTKGNRLISSIYKANEALNKQSMPPYYTYEAMLKLTNRFKREPKLGTACSKEYMLGLKEYAPKRLSSKVLTISMKSMTQATLECLYEDSCNEIKRRQHAKNTDR